MSTQARRDEILAKKAKLADLKRQREQREKDLRSTRQSLDAVVTSTYSSAEDVISKRSSINRADLDSLVASLVDRPRSLTSASSQFDIHNNDNNDTEKRNGGADKSTITRQNGSAKEETGEKDEQRLGIAQLRTVYDSPAEQRVEVVTYSKGVQTTEDVTSPDQRDQDVGTNTEDLRANIRREIEEELRHVKEDPQTNVESEEDDQKKFPLKRFTETELHAISADDEFLDFVERSTKVIERAMEEDYDVLADYATRDIDPTEAEDEGGGSGKRGRGIKQIIQFQSEQTKKRMISDLDFSNKYPELLLTSYTKAANSIHTAPGLALIWNVHMASRPEYTFTATSDLLCAQFSPYHPNIVLGGTYSGQVCMWDIRQRSNDGAPVQKTPLAGDRGGHAHPIYSLSVVGTQNANNIISVSTDGTACAWSFDMLSKPQEHLDLTWPQSLRTKIDEVAPTCISFPQADPTYFLAGTEDGSIVPVHRYDQAGSKAGIDQKTIYQSHTAPITGLDFHPNRGKADLGDLALSSSFDWSIKLWRIRPHIVTAITAAGGIQIEKPLLDIPRDDVVYDVKWSPVKPGLFGSVNGAGKLEIFDLSTDTETPVCSAQPSHLSEDLYGIKSLNKLTWEYNQGRRVAVGGLDGIVTVFEVGNAFGGAESLARTEEWTHVKKLMNRMDRTNL